MSAQTIRVVIADDHGLFRAGLRKLLEAEPGFSVVGEAEDGMRAIELARQLAPDVLLLDFAMPRMTGLDVLRQLRSTGRPMVRTVVLTASITSDDIAAALSAGAAGVLMKTVAEELLYECVRSTADGYYWIGRETVGSLIEALAKFRAGPRGTERPFGLTRRELQIAQLVAESWPNRDIAQRLHISEDTVKHHLSRAFDKTGTSSRTELAVFAHHHDLGRITDS